MIKLLGNRVLIERIKIYESDGGILLPDKWTQRQLRGTVIEAGNGKRKDNNKNEFIPLDLKKGDTILFDKFDGVQVLINGELYWILEEQEIIAVLEN